MYKVVLETIKTWNFRNNSIIYGPQVWERKTRYNLKCYKCEKKCAELAGHTNKASNGKPFFFLFSCRFRRTCGAIIWTLKPGLTWAGTVTAWVSITRTSDSDRPSLTRHRVMLHATLLIASVFLVLKINEMFRRDGTVRRYRYKDGAAVEMLACLSL